MIKMELNGEESKEGRKKKVRHKYKMGRGRGDGSMIVIHANATRHYCELQSKPALMQLQKKSQMVS